MKSWKFWYPNEYNIYKDILRSKGKNKIKCDRKWIKFHFN